MNMLIFLFLSILCLNDVFAFNILLIFPYAGQSHRILGNGYVRHLLKAGHEVTYITSKSIKPQPRLKQIDVSLDIGAIGLEKSFSFDTYLKSGNPISTASAYEYFAEVSNNSITHHNVQKFLMENDEKFDLVIAEWLFTELYCGFAAVFDVPYIWSSSTEPHPMILSLIDEPSNPSYFPDFISPIFPPLSFTDRVNELWGCFNLLMCRWGLRDVDEKNFRDAFGPAADKRGIQLPTLEELKYKGSMVLANSHVSSGIPYRLPQNFIPIAGYHIEEDQPLPENLQKIMDNSPNGVIYFSMGTMVQSNTMPEPFKKELLNVFSELSQTVIWKFEEELQNLPKNVHIVQWAPQQNILAHPKCRLFITHGGLLSTTEAIHFGVPIIGIPLFGDQHSNVMRSVNKGIAIKVDLHYDTPAKLKIAIQEMITNPKYREKINELSFVYHHRPTTPGTALVHWAEHVIKTKGAPHLQSPALYVPLYQKLYLDLAGIILIGLLVVIILAMKLTSGLKKGTQKTHQKKKN